jgi:hypothetical protein
MPEYECIPPRPFMPCCSSFSDLTHRAERERQRVGEKQRGKRERDFVGDTAIFKPLLYVFTVCS